MSRKAAPEVTGAVLGWVNEQRVERGHEPLPDLLPGLRRQFEGCPIARSLGIGQKVQVASWGWRETDPIVDVFPGTWQPVPAEVADFMRRFDSGVAYQQYHETINPGG